MKKSSKKFKYQIAEECGISPDTLRTILKNRDQLYSELHTTLILDMKKKAIEDLLIKWLNNCQDLSIRISGPLLITKAKDLTRKFGYPINFVSHEWLEKLMVQHGFVFSRECHGHAWVNSHFCEYWNNQLSLIIRKCDNIFNAHHSCMFFDGFLVENSVVAISTCHSSRGKCKTIILLLIRIFLELRFS